MKRYRWVCGWLCVVAALAMLPGCGGGNSSVIGNAPQGSESLNVEDEERFLPAPMAEALVPDCSVAENSCGANGDTYKGSGVGVWRYGNYTDDSVELPIALSGVAGKQLTLVYTNESSADRNLPPIPAESGPAYHNLIGDTDTAPDGSNHVEPLETTRVRAQMAILEKHNFINALRAIRRNLKANPPPMPRSSRLILPDISVGDTQNWKVENEYDYDITTRTATLKRQFTVNNPTTQLTRDVHIWVEDSEFGAAKVSDNILTQLASRFPAVYSNVVGIAGEPWGDYSGSDLAPLLIPADQPLNIVIVNFDHNQMYSGMVGYFGPSNAFLNGSQNSYCGSAHCDISNEALVLFIDAEAFYLAADPVNTQLSTLAHELLHAINFYQRNILMNDVTEFDTFLEEMTATMMEDILQRSIFGENSNQVLKGRHIPWLRSGLYGCSLLEFGYDCARGSSLAGYNQSGSFGAYLLRQYGYTFYKNLLRDTTPQHSSYSASLNQVFILNNVIAETNAERELYLGRLMQRWGANLALLPLDVPKYYGLPEATLNVPGLGSFVLDGFDGSTYDEHLPSADYLLANGPSDRPILAYALSLLRRDVVGVTQDDFNDVVTVPSGVSIVVVVH